MSRKKFFADKEHEIAKAGKLVFDAIFGDDKELEQRISKELELEATAPPAEPTSRPVIDVPAYLVVRCAGCTREAVLPSHVDVRALALVGWMHDARTDSWRCPTCVAPGRPR